MKFFRFSQSLKLAGCGHVIEFSLDVFTGFAEFSDKSICLYSKMTQTCQQATCYVRDQDATFLPVPFRENSNVTNVHT